MLGYTPAAMHDKRFPGETAGYRAARDKLLQAEIDLLDQTWKVAAQRAALPPGGPVSTDYVFVAAGGKKVKLSQLFQPGQDTLVLYSFMYGPKMKEACPMCTSLLDGLEGQSEHIRQRVSFAVVAKSPIARILAHAKKRGWKRLQMLSSAKNTYNLDYHGEDEADAQWSALNVFSRRGGTIHHTYGTELQFLERGHDSCHVDSIWPLWNMFDFTPDGRGADWYPALSYPKKRTGHRRAG